MGNTGELDVVAIDRSVRAQQRLVHLDATAHLYGADGIRGHGLINEREPSHVGGSAAGATLSDAFGFQSAGGLKNDLVNLAHGLGGIVRGFVMMFGVVAGRDGEGKIQLVAVESPIADEASGELPIIFLHFGKRGTQSCEATGHAGVLAVVGQHQPFGMLLYNVGELVGAVVQDVGAVSVLDHNGNPPQRGVKTGSVEGIGNLFYAIETEVCARLPVSTDAEPSSIEGGPLQS